MISFSLLLLSGCIAHQDERDEPVKVEVEQSKNPEIKLRGETMNFAKQFYDALDVSAVSREENERVVDKRKEVEGLVCTEIISPKSYSCFIPKNMLSSQIDLLFKKLKVRSYDFSGVEVKAIGPVLIGLFQDERKIIYVQECLKIGTIADVDRCINFWSTQIIPSLEQKNIVFTTSTKSVMENLPALVKSRGMRSDADVKRLKDRIDKAFALAVVFQSVAEEDGHLFYFTFNQGNMIVPNLVFHLSGTAITGDSDRKQWGLGFKAIEENL